MGEEEKTKQNKTKPDEGVDSSLASEGIDLFVDFWEAQLCLWDATFWIMLSAALLPQVRAEACISL